MSRGKTDGLWPMVMVPQKEWRALVLFFKEEEKVMRDSFSIPGRRGKWAEDYRKDYPDHFKIYDAARRAASRKFKSK